MSDLRSVLESHADAAWSAAAEADVPVPGWRRRVVERMSRCGDPYTGFVWWRCDPCGVDRLVASSCKVSGVCPRCGGRRMGSVAAHLAERVLPAVLDTVAMSSMLNTLAATVAEDPKQYAE
ncbi:MAG: hypothetical protein ACI8PZ_006781 [Myxococcota bacterium]|jgi:hypothetical protein